MNELPRTYQEAGVDINLLNRLRRYGQAISETTKTPYIEKRDASFVIVGERVAHDFPNPRFFSETDGIGTKEDLLATCGRYHTAGWDLVAANVNDIVRHRATPLGMTVDIKFPQIKEEQFREFMNGVRDGLLASSCALLGGETAMHPQLGGKFWTLSGQVIGVAERERVKNAPKPSLGDVVIGIASSGIHTNGTSLAFKVMEETGAKEHITTLLGPSRIYTNPILRLVNSGLEIHGLAHVTGGGLTDRIGKIIPPTYAPSSIDQVGRSSKYFCRDRKIRSDWPRDDVSNF